MRGTGIAIALRVGSSSRTAALLAVVGFILHLSSERTYWNYSPAWFGSRIQETVILSAFYAFAAGLAVWALARIPYRGWHQVVLAGAVFAWTVEGVVVQVLHEAGPVDLVYPAMFAGWHGLLSFGGFLVLVRRLLVERRPVALAAWSAGYGVVAGLWATTSWLPDSDPTSDLGEDAITGIATPEDYALMMLLVVTSLALAHLLLDRIWSAAWRPSRLFGWVVISATAAVAALGFATVPYGPIRYAALVAVPLLALHASGPRSDHPTLFAALGGSIRAQHLVALAPAAAAAAVVYALAWGAGLDRAALEAMRDLQVLAQVFVGGGVLLWALARAATLSRAARQRSLPTRSATESRRGLPNESAGHVAP